MKAATVFLGAVSVSCLASYVIVTVSLPADLPAVPGQPGAATAETSREDVSQSLRSFEDRLTRLENAIARSSVGDPEDDGDRIERAVAAWMEKNAADVSVKAGAVVGIDLDRTIGQLRSGQLSEEEEEAVWARCVKAGLLGRLIAAMETAAKANPGDADLQAHLADAYIQQLVRVKTQVEQADLAMKADVAYDRALKINPEHWDARFGKAVSLSHWPPIFGKQAQAMEQFELLIEKQKAAATRRPEHAHSYLLLGNLYQQQGNEAKAREIWQAGYDSFPSDQRLHDLLK